MSQNSFMPKTLKPTDTYHPIGASSDLSDVSYSTRLTPCHPAFSPLKPTTFLPKVYFLSSFSVDVGVHWSHEMFYFWKALKDGVNEIFFV